MPDTHCNWKWSILWYFLEKKTILIFSQSKHSPLPVKMDKKKISLLFAPLLYITFLLSGNMSLILWPFLLKVLRHTLTSITSFSFSNLKNAIPDVAQCSPPEHNLLVFNISRGILLVFITGSFLFIALTNATTWYIQISTIITGGGKKPKQEIKLIITASTGMVNASCLIFNSFSKHFFSVPLFLSVLLPKIAYS